MICLLRGISERRDGGRKDSIPDSEICELTLGIVIIGINSMKNGMNTIINVWV
jgi:hypothetical protein